MSLCSSSTFSFDQMSPLYSSRFARAVAIGKVVGWAVLFLLLSELVVSGFVRIPTNTRVAMSGAAAYLDYGRSIEGKLRRNLADSDENAQPVSSAGWIANECRRDIPLPEQGLTAVSFFGMSFSNDIAKALEEGDERYVSVRFAGPGAPPNHSYACFMAQLAHSAAHGGDPSKIVVLGILSSSVDGMLSMTGATTGFESPVPFTYPRYRIARDGTLHETRPIIESTDDWRKALVDRTMMQRFKLQLEANDAFYDPWSFDESLRDRSYLLRLLGRAYGQSRVRRAESLVGGPDAFLDHPDIGPVLSLMIENFSRQVRLVGKRPVVLLIQSRGSGQSLTDLLGKALEANQVSFLSTQQAADSHDPANYLADGHFKPEVNQRIAEELRKLMAH